MEEEKVKSNSVSNWRTNMSYWLSAVFIIALGCFIYFCLEYIYVSISIFFIAFVYIIGLLAKTSSVCKKAYDYALYTMKIGRICLVYLKMFLIFSMTICLPMILLYIVLYFIMRGFDVTNESADVFISVFVISILSLFPWYGNFLMDKCHIRAFISRLFMESCEYNAAHIRFYMYVAYFVLIAIFSTSSYLCPTYWKPNELIDAFILYFAADRIISHLDLIKDILKDVTEKYECVKQSRNNLM